MADPLRKLPAPEDMPTSRNPPARDPQEAWRKAETIGASGLGSHYVDDEAPVRGLWDALKRGARGLTGQPEITRHVQAMDPFGISTWEQGKGPMPMFGMTTVGPKAIPLSDYDGYVRRVAAEGLMDALSGPSKHMDEVIEEIRRGHMPAGRTAGDFFGTAQNYRNVTPSVETLTKSAPILVDEMKNRGTGVTGNVMSNTLVDTLGELTTTGHKKEWYKP